MELSINDRFVNRTVKYFNEFSFKLAYNSVGSTFQFVIDYDYTNPEHKEMDCVSHYHEATVTHLGQTLLTGVLVSQKFSVSKVKNLSSFFGYSSPGVLEDSSIPPESYPLQSNNLTLTQIANKLVRPLRPKLDIVIDDSVADRMNSSFDTSTASPTSKIKGYLADLAQQKNIIMSHNELGALVFTEAKTNMEPLIDFDLTKEVPIGFEFDFDFNGQAIHSHITVKKQASMTGGNAGDFTLRNPYVIGSVYRPLVLTQSSGTDNDTKLVAKRALANELRNLPLTIKMDRWDLDGVIVRPNNTITIYAPQLYIWKKTTFFIESIDFSGNNTEQTATLHCVLPECYTNEVPVSIFAGINIYAKDHV